MEGQVTKHRHRRYRKRTLFERIKALLEMPRLKRSERNQRLAIAGVLVAMAVYFLVIRPVMNVLFPYTPTRTQKSGPGPAPGKTGLQKKKT